MTTDVDFGAEAPLTLEWLAQALAPVLVSASWRSAQPNATFTTLSTDSRAMAAGMVFVALKGERFDAHNSVPQIAQQALAAVVERECDAPVTQFVVRDTRLAYGLVAKAWRARYSLKLTAVGGSNGKTTTTQMLAAIVREVYGQEKTLATEGNFNNDVGVPRMLMKLRFAHRAAVIEAGMNHPGEMALLADWIRPTTVLITNAQREHQEFLSSVRETAYENGLLIAAMAPTGTAVFPSDDPCAPIWAAYAIARGVRAVSYATGEPVKGFVPDVTGCLLPDGRLEISGFGECFTFPLKIRGAHNYHNAVGAAAAALAQGMPVEAVVRGLSGFEALRGRGARWHAKQSALTLIDDAYNANPDSVLASMRMVAESGLPASRLCFILGDMAEVGDDALMRHAEVGAAAKALGIGHLWCVGDCSRAAAEAFGNSARVYPTRDALLAELKTLIAPFATDEPALVAVKASHSMGLERVAAAIVALEDNE